MNKAMLRFTAGCCLLFHFWSTTEAAQTISKTDYINKMRGGWAGQSAGVVRCTPIEFRYMGQRVPDEEYPAVWKAEMINDAFNQDDIYVELSFLKMLDDYGFDISQRQVGIDFANTEFWLDQANYFSRENLRKGIAPPDNAHPGLTPHGDDIDYQIESDFAGLIAPGMPNYPVEAGNKFGRVINYGDGVYGGEWIGAMYSLAFFENDVEKIVERSLEYIPKDSQYHECISDILTWYRANPDDWKQTWELANQKYNNLAKYRQGSCELWFNIDAKFNGAFVAIGLLYGKGNFDDTIRIAGLCGQDSDCNASSAGGIVGTIIGYDKLDAHYKQFNPKLKFTASPYTIDDLYAVSTRLAAQLVVRKGGRIYQENEEEIWEITEETPTPDTLLQSFSPDNIIGSCFSEEEMRQIKYRMDRHSKLRDVYPGWKLFHCQEQTDAGYHADFKGRKNVLVAMTRLRGVPCVLSRDYEVPATGEFDQLHFETGYLPEQDFEIQIRVDGKEIYKKPVNRQTVHNNNFEDTVDLSEYAGKKINLSILQIRWAGGTVYWYDVSFRSKSGESANSVQQ